MNAKLVWAILILAAITYLVTRPSTPKPVTPTPAYSPIPDQTSTPDQGEVPEQPTFRGDPCTSDCGGHEAGYNWAEEHGIDDADDCDTAGDTSNSPSFAEGCRAYVEENSPSKDDDNDN
jgi:hypothetical protein